MNTELGRVAARAARGNVPFSVQLEITGRCNLDCQHCYLDIKKPPPEMSTETIFGILDQLAAAGTMFLVITGGEVFLRKDLIPILKYARGLGFAVRLFTSGTRMTRAHAREIATLGLTAVEMSLYGAKCDVHDTITRRPGSHRKTIRAALMLKRLGVTVILKSPVFAGTAGGHRDFIKLAERVGASAKLDPSIMMRRNGDLAPTHLRSSAGELAGVLRDLLNIKPGDALPPPASPDKAPCAIGRRTARIGPEGNVYPCATYPTPVGNLNERSFAAIWSGDSPLLARLRAVTFKDFGPTCTGCSKSGYCSRCLAMALIEHGDERAPVAQSCRIAEARDIAAAVPDAKSAPGLTIARERNAGRRSLPLVG